MTLGDGAVLGREIRRAKALAQLLGYLQDAVCARL